jgi:hypothetical protein
VNISEQTLRDVLTSAHQEQSLFFHVFRGWLHDLTRKKIMNDQGKRDGVSALRRVLEVYVFFCTGEVNAKHLVSGGLNEGIALELKRMPEFAYLPVEVLRNGVQVLQKGLEAEYKRFCIDRNNQEVPVRVVRRRSGAVRGQASVRAIR